MPDRSDDYQADDATTRVEVTTHRTVRVLGVNDRPALELTNVDGLVAIALMPRSSGGKRSPVRLDDLRAAVEGLTP